MPGIAKMWPGAFEMSRRKIKNGTHAKSPRGHRQGPGKAPNDYHVAERRRQENADDDREMSRLIGNGSVDLKRRYDAMYISQTARDYDWNQTRFKKALERWVPEQIR